MLESIGKKISIGDACGMKPKGKKKKEVPADSIVLLWESTMSHPTLQPKERVGNT